MQILLSTVDNLISGEINTQPRQVHGTTEFQHAVQDLIPYIEKVPPGIPNPRWIAIRLLDGDHRVQQALLSGELGELVRSQTRAEVNFSSQIALNGRQ